jgi:hypothetical protein
MENTILEQFIRSNFVYLVPLSVLPMEDSNKLSGVLMVKICEYKVGNVISSSAVLKVPELELVIHQYELASSETKEILPQKELEGLWEKFWIFN